MNDTLQRRRFYSQKDEPLILSFIITALFEFESTKIFQNQPSIPSITGVQHFLFAGLIL